MGFEENPTGKRLNTILAIQLFSCTPDKDIRVFHLYLQILSHPCYLTQDRIKITCWLVVLGFNGPLRQYFSLYHAVSQREGERGKRIDESKNVQTKK